MPPTFFVTGTGTDVGKTYVACMIARALRHAGSRVGVYKPVASGCRDVNGCRVADDAFALSMAAGCPEAIDIVCPQRFLAPLAPPAAAAIEGRTIDTDLLRHGADHWNGNCDVLIIEGAGGLFSPLADGVLNIDLAIHFADAKIIVVAANQLGVIHQTLATIEAARQRGLQVAGIILCDSEPSDDQSSSSNASQIMRYTEVPVLAQVPFNSSFENHSDSDAGSDAESGVLSAFFSFCSTNFKEALFMQ